MYELNAFFPVLNPLPNTYSQAPALVYQGGCHVQNCGYGGGAWLYTNPQYYGVRCQFYTCAECEEHLTMHGFATYN